MARTLTSRQQEALESDVRSTHVAVRIEDADGAMVDVRDLEGYDLFSQASIRASVEEPISSAIIQLWRTADPGDGGPLYSLAPLIESSLFNRDSGGSYAPLAHLARRVEIDIATMLEGETPSAGDFERLWEGYVDEVDWGGIRSRVQLFCRDPMSRLNDTMIETISTYGGGSPLEPIEDVMQRILDDHMGSGEFELWVEGDPDFGLDEERYGDISVLGALMGIVDRIGWSLHWRWQESPGEFRLTLYQPQRDRASLSGFEPDWTFGPDRYYDLPGVRLSLGGVRTAGEVVYVDMDGVQQRHSETRSGPEADFRRRFARFDETEERQIRTEAQAQGYLGSVLDDLSVPPLLQKVDAPIHWPIELCDVFEFEANNVHYDTAQVLAVFGYEHIIAPKRLRTMIDTSGQPSGGYRRWLAKEVQAIPQTGVIHKDESDRVAPGDFAENIVCTITVPANALGLNGDVEVEAVMESSTFTDTSYWRVRLNGELVFQTEAPALTVVRDWLFARISNDHATNAQKAIAGITRNPVTAYNPGDPIQKTSHAEDSTADLVITITVQHNDNTNDVTLESSRAVVVDA